MSASWMPFLYQTRTLQRVWRVPAKARVAQLAQPSFRGYQTRRRTNDDTDTDSIPFDWGAEGKPDLSTWNHDQDLEDPEGPTPLTPNSTITPTEAYAFRRIFDEISTGKMPTPKKRRFPGTGPDAGAEEAQASAGFPEPSRSIVEQARMNEFRSSVLSRFPEDLRNAAHLALGIYETKSGTDYEVQEETTEQRRERLKYEQQREDEKARIESLMSDAESDLELWKVMEAEVFSLPQKLGILEEETKASGRGRGKKQSPQQKLRKGETLMGKAGSDAVRARSSSTRGGQKHNIAVHGPLYTHFLSHGLTLFATSFRRPSPFAFQILPRVKELGLPSYVLGVSSRFYAALARMHWEQFGNAGRALDIIEEMNAAGLYANYDVKELLGRLRSEIVTCSSDVQGQLTQAVMDMPPFDGELLDRLDQVEENCMRPMSHLDE
jgi:hypothetical protein